MDASKFDMGSGLWVRLFRPYRPQEEVAFLSEWEMDDRGVEGTRIDRRDNEVDISRVFYSWRTILEVWQLEDFNSSHYPNCEQVKAGTLSRDKCTCSAIQYEMTRVE